MSILIVAKYFLLVSIVIAGAQVYFFVTFPPTAGVDSGVAAHVAVVPRLVVDPEPTVGVFVLLSPPHATRTQAPAAMPTISHLIIDPPTPRNDSKGDRRRLGGETRAREHLSVQNVATVV